jgi:hypothetical protein
VSHDLPKERAPRSRAGEARQDGVIAHGAKENPRGERGGEGTCSRNRPNNPSFTPPTERLQHRCLAAVIAAADEAAQARLFICRCPHCAELLILPKRPVAVALPGGRCS